MRLAGPECNRVKAVMCVHPGFRVHHVCTENADVVVWRPIGADMILEDQHKETCSRQIASRSNPL
jgi:hypothetical protein